jgi:hypothetical protein
MQSRAAEPAQPLDLSPAELHVLDRFRDKVEAWGWRYELAPDGVAAGGHGGAGAARLTHAAVVLGVPLNGTELQVPRIGASLTMRPEMTPSETCINGYNRLVSMVLRKLFQKGPAEVHTSLITGNMWNSPVDLLQKAVLVHE